MSGEKISGQGMPPSAERHGVLVGPAANFPTGGPVSELRSEHSFVLPRERARLQEKFQKRREGYFTIINGERQLDLGHKDIAEVKKYSNDVLNSEKVDTEGRKTGLRVRASERNKGNTEMELMGQMSIQELVAYTKEHRPIHLKNGSNELLLPKDYPKATAGEQQWGEALFYHDAPLLLKGILASDIPDKVEYAQGMVENFVYELYLLHMIPNGSALQLINRSQPPSLTEMAWNVYDAMQEQNPQDKEKNIAWLGTVMEAAEYEFDHYWKNKDKYHHTVEGSPLVTPGDTDIGAHDTSERETGRDMSREYLDRAHDHQDPNINGRLVGYAWDIAFFKRMTGAKKEEVKKWENIGDEMASKMGEVMFDGKSYVAYDARRAQQQTGIVSLSGYMPLALGVPDVDQAQEMANSLDRLRGPYGLSHILPESIPPDPTPEMLASFPPGIRETIRNIYGARQWGDWDGQEKEEGKKINIPEWPIETHGVIAGLERYGFYNQAIDIAEDWLLGYTEYFNTHGTLPEKRNTLTGENGHGVEYGQQVDFGWSIANYLWLLQELPRLYMLRNKQKARMASEVRPDVPLVRDVVSGVVRDDEPVTVFAAAK